MRVLILILCLATSLSVLAQGQKVSKADWQYKPIDLADAVMHLEKIVDDSTKTWIMGLEEDDYLGSVHFSMGLWIRNNWDLWKGGKLADHFHSLDITHPDDMSGIILTCFYRELKALPWLVKEQVAYYQKYWQDALEHESKMETDTAYARQQKEETDRKWQEYYDERKSWFPPGTEVEFRLTPCGFMNGKHTLVYGKVKAIEGNDALIEITGYIHHKAAKRLSRCNKIEDNTVRVHVKDLNLKNH